MINTRPTIVPLTTDTEALSDAISNAIEEVRLYHQDEHGIYDGQRNHNRRTQWGFLRAYHHHLRDCDIRNPKQCLDSLLAACSGRLSREKLDHLSSVLNLTSPIHIPLCQYSGLSNGLTGILMCLWKQGYIILNPWFSPNVKTVALERFEAPTVTDIKRFSRESKHYTEQTIYDVHHHTKRLFWATNWVTWNNFNIDELAFIHSRWLATRRQLKAQGNLTSDSYPNIPIPFRVLLTIVTGPLAHLTGLSSEDVNYYDFKLADLTETENESPATIARSASADARFESWMSLPPERREEAAVFSTLRNLRRTEARRYGWPGANRPQPLWEALPIKNCAETWTKLFDLYIADWGERYESQSKRKYLSVFNDYLFLYLNWWFHKHGDPDPGFPARPGDIKRFTHIKRGVQNLRPEEHLTFTEFLERRYDSATQRANALRAALDFFDWVIEEYSGTTNHQLYFDVDFKNPVREKDIHHKNANKRKHATVRLGKRHATLYADYLLAIESFFTMIERRAFEQYQAKNGDPHYLTESLPLDRIPALIEPERFGYIPIVFDNGRVIPLKKIPTVYSRNDIALTKGFRVPSHLPNLSAIRVLCFLMETGLRGAHVRWLDRISFPRPQTTLRSPCAIIHVNTDKAGDAFDIPVSDEAFNILTRQQQAVDSMIGDSTVRAVPYQGRPNSRFPDINVLFYAPRANPTAFKVITDGLYRHAFRLSMASYTLWLSEADGQPADLARSQRDESLEELLSNSKTVVEDCIELDHSPHSIRSTVISDRISVLPIRLVAKLAGQRNASTAAYYHQLDENDLYAVLNGKPVESVLQVSLQADSPVYIRAAGPSSSLAKSVRENRGDAEMAYGMTSMTFGQSEAGSSGLKSFREAAESELAYFDTHICPFAGRCPDEVVVELGESHRCGICQYAVKSVDHLPAISAKIRSLEERSRRHSKEAERAFKAGSVAESQRLSDIADMVATEMIGWHLAESVLEHKLNEIRHGNSQVERFHVDEPEILRRRLARAEFPESDVARLLLRIGEANAYPSMQDEFVRQVASRLKRKVKGVEEPLFEDAADPVGELCSYLLARMELEGLSTNDVIHQLEGHRDALPLQKSAGVSPFKQLLQESPG